MNADPTAWALLAAGILIPLAAHAARLSFVLRDIDGGPYFLMSPLWFVLWQPLVLITSRGGYEEGKKLAQTWADYIIMSSSTVLSA